MHILQILHFFPIKLTSFSGSEGNSVVIIRVEHHMYPSTLSDRDSDFWEIE